MASKHGTRVAGTDGTDFSHRERVAVHYKSSVVNKFRLKFSLFLHLSLSLLMLLRLSADLVDMLGLWDILPDALHMSIPAAKPWEYVWMCSMIGVLLCYASLNRSNEVLLRYGFYAVFSFALLPVLYGIGVTIMPLIRYVKGEHAENDIDRFHGFPMILLYAIFFTIALQVHCFTMYFAVQLLKAWAPVSGKKKAQ